MSEAALDIITEKVHPQEVCYGMWQGPRGERWILKLWVLRGDAIARWEQDCGPASKYERIPEQVIPGDEETTVAEFLYEAERHRNDLFAWNHLQRVKAESTLVKDINEQREARREYIRNRSVNGPHFKIERSIYNRENAWRKFFDERSARTGKRVFTP